MKKTLFIALLAVLALGCRTDALAQTTHAHSSSSQWEGIDVLDVLANPANYPGVTGAGIPVYLYNVGTGRFAVDGGNWGMEARLFYEDFGRMMWLRIQDGVLKIDPKITHSSSAKCMLACNVPLVTRSEKWNQAPIFNTTTILDGYKYWGKWNFVRIPSENSESEFHTYYMYQQHNEGTAYSNAKNKSYQGVDLKNLTIRFGAAYGEYCSDGTTTFTDGTTNDKGCGYYVNVDDDRSCWTTAGNANNTEDSPWGNQTKVSVNGDMVTIDELYQWRIISEEEFITKLNEEIIGINPSISSLVPDRDFTRNSDEFFPNWKATSSNTTTPPEGEGRLGHTWGNFKKGTNQTSADYKYNNEAWDKALMLKKVFENIKEAKYGFMSFEGIGTVSVSFEVPQPGWYQIEASAISFSDDPTHTAYMYAHPNWVTPTDDLREASNSAFQGYEEEELVNEPNPDAVAAKYSDVSFPSTKTKDSRETNLAIGKVLTMHGDDYRHKFWIYINPTKYSESDANKKVTLGFRKDYAIKSRATLNEGTSYYYDKDWICIDDIKVSYMGLAPVFFYETEQNLDYLVFDSDYIDERPSAQPGGLYGGAVSLERTMKKNQLNSFSFPIPLTGEQVRLAFGEDTQLMELNSIGQISNNSRIIDFKSVELKPEDPNTQVVKPGKMYLIIPTADPVVGKDPMGRKTEYYELGRNYFSVDATQAPDGYEHTIIDVEHPYASCDIPSLNDENDGVSHVSYISTPGGFDDAGNKVFPIDANGIYNGSLSIDGLYVANEDYALTTLDIDGEQFQGFCEVNKDTPVKGFRAWLTLTHSIFDDSEDPVQNLIAINGIISSRHGQTAIASPQVSPARPADDTAIYDLSGRKAGSLTQRNLQKGIYIVAGRKMLVR